MGFGEETYFTEESDGDLLITVVLVGEIATSFTVTVSLAELSDATLQSQSLLRATSKFDANFSISDPVTC